jgi:hypothetical protein
MAMLRRFQLGGHALPHEKVKAIMLQKWSPEFAAKVSKHIEAILNGPHSHSPSQANAARYIKGLLVYGDLGGVIALTLSGEFVGCDHELESVTTVREQLWIDVALASLGKHYPDLRGLLPDRPAQAPVCPNCSGSGWMMDGRLYCARCRGLGWLEQLPDGEEGTTTHA